MKKIISILLLIGYLPLFAQEDPAATQESEGTGLKEIIIEGNRIQVPFSQITRDIQVVTRKQIEELPVKSLNEVLAYVSGIDIRQRGPFGTQADISIDGGTSEQTIILINGVKLLDAQTAHNMMNVPVPLSAIDHIEVLRGAAARVYGINALTGAINIVTRKEKHSFITADVQGGSSLKHKDHDDGTGIYGGGSAAVTANIGDQKQTHLFAVSQDHYNGQRYNSASANSRLFYNGNYNFNSDNSLQLMAGYARSRFGANGFYAAPGDINSEELVRTSVFSISSKHQWGRVTVTPRISDRYGEDDYRYFKDDLGRARSQHYTNALMPELNAGVKTKIGTVGLGWESRIERISSSNIGRHHRSNHGAYAELRSHPGTKIRRSVGLYANYNTDFGWQFYPGADAAWLINTHWKISGNIGSGQRIPSFTDLYLNQLPGNIGNESLQPESAWNYQGNVQFNKGNLNTQVGYFYRNITGFIDWVRQDDTHPYSPVNFGRNKMQGLYIRTQQEFDFGNQRSLSYTFSYNYLHPDIATLPGDQSKYVLESLKHQFIAGIHYRLKRLSLQAENRWLKRELAGGYDVADIRINYQWPRFILYSEVSNLFNAEYREAGAVPMPLRWISVGIRVNISFLPDPAKRSAPVGVF